MKKDITSKTGSSPVIKVGHTYSNRNGAEPNATVRGGAVNPTEITFGK